MTGDGPLQGVRVLDLTHFVAGPWCTMMLADLGAEVVKVEPPGQGEIGRNMGAVYTGDESAVFLGFNRNKRSAAIDLKASAGQQVLADLADRADVVVQNFRPAVARRLGVDPDSLRATRPALISCAVSAFGSTGPDADRPANDPIIQAASGAMWLTRDEAGRPARMGVSLPDFAAGVLSALSITAALRRRSRNGQGCSLELSLLDAQLYAQCDRLDANPACADEHHTGAGIHRGVDGGYVYRSGEVTVPVNGLSAAIAGMTCGVIKISHGAADQLRSLATPISARPPLPDRRSAPPRLGEHTREVLAELGYDARRIDDLHLAGVVTSTASRRRCGPS